MRLADVRADHPRRKQLALGRRPRARSDAPVDVIRDRYSFGQTAAGDEAAELVGHGCQGVTAWRSTAAPRPKRGNLRIPVGDY
jgi:hypothetical protein